MSLFERLKTAVIGPPRDPLAPGARHSLLLIAFLAWVGIGADGISSANYGPQEAFLALGSHSYLALYLAAATAITVFLLAMAYCQVIELFPSGGGGYKVASKLIGPYAGAVSGSALIVDYILTVAISMAAASDALFSLLPTSYHFMKMPTTLFFVVLLLVLNLRGVKESIKILMPLFIGFIVTHIGFIVTGIVMHSYNLPDLIPNTIADTHFTIAEVGVAGLIALLLKAFAMGGGTYTGIEAVSNNMQILAEPRVRTAKATMMYLALSLALMAAGLIVLYLIWDVKYTEGMTLNATTFQLILAQLFPDNAALNQIILTMTMFFAAALLFVAANAGYLAGPAIMANMARDDWLPHQFTQLSSRLVTGNGMILMCVAAVLVLLFTQGEVHVLVVLYSINVFLTFSLSLWGLVGHWLRSWRRGSRRYVWARLLLSLVTALVSTGILCVTIFEKFAHGAWLTVLITGSIIITCLYIRDHYRNVARRLAAQNQQVVLPEDVCVIAEPPALDKTAPTAVFLVSQHMGLGMQLVMAVMRLFPDRFKNFVFLRVGEVDSDNFGGPEKLADLKRDVEGDLGIYTNYMHNLGYAVDARHAYGPDKLAELLRLADEIHSEYKNVIFFSAKLVFENENFFSRMLHNNTAYAMQQQLHLKGMSLMVLPIKV
ncbi:MAG TPA: APC family permease [Alphaproteobacteria bacterium]|nr:amino acid transporter [Rhodospirillaceae bacterium]HRJ12143.1 APC family permease [Alphaproteobacteria bacterium]